MDTENSKASSPTVDDEKHVGTVDEGHGSEDANEPTYPDGGLRAWITVFGSFIIQFCGFGYTTSFGVYQDYYTRVYITNESSSAISWIGSVNAFLVIASGVVAGRLYDKGYFYFLLYGGAILISFSLFMLSLAKPDNIYQNFLAQGIGHGLGAGMMYVPSIALVSQYFKKRRALAMSFVAAGSSLGAFVHPIMLNNTLNGHLGFGGAVRASAGLVTGLLVIACCLMRPRLPPPTVVHDLGKSLKRYSRDIPFIAASAGLTFFTIGFYFPLFFLQLDAIKHNLSERFGFYALVMMNATSFVARMSAGLLAQRLGVMNMITVSTGCCAVLIFCMIALKTVASVVLLAVIYGFFSGIFITLMAPLIAILTEDVTELGVRMGISFAFCGVGALIGPPINGALLTGQFIWWKPALFSGMFALLGFLCFVGMLLILHRWKKND
ncbi:MFS general substrate transporter [Crucibulum laeve]|uniref:MFS general substrate transporter n=1 Tax=Crucibulum laeve TaxID=68775 RepID=A0A5C3M1K2_9AGAR|nr:MFS general substrate transporter [Crucibulum laeve]